MCSVLAASGCEVEPDCAAECVALFESREVCAEEMLVLFGCVAGQRRIECFDELDETSTPIEGSP